MKEQTEEQEQATPPYFDSWRSIYLIVMANLFLIILLLYFFSITYR